MVLFGLIDIFVFALLNILLSVFIVIFLLFKGLASFAFELTLKHEKLQFYPKVRFLGLFDTVHSFPYIVAWAWEDDSISDNVKNSAHAIASDENRTFFRVSHLNPPEFGTHNVRFFPGVHSDIGGHKDMNFVIGDYTLRWMIDQAMNAGVKMSVHGLPTMNQFESRKWKNPNLFRPSENSGLTNLFQW